MQQHLMQMQPMMAAYYPNNVTTDHIQQFLDENKSLILKIVESQNSGKLSECAESQAKLQRNLMYLAAIADSQPQPPNMHSQLASGGMMQAGQHYLQQQLTTQSLMAAARSSSSMLYGQQQQQSLSALQQQQAYHNQLGMSSSGGGSSSGFHMLQNDNTHNSSTSLGFPDFGRGGNKQDIGNSLSDQGRGGSSSSHGGDGGENLYLKAADDGN
ncbi:GRF1-interacting factor 1-like isoform X2 [Nicotiana tabacum]|uniref:GRF1-interacting factor 1-like n=2 Tax=Nicotiana TaxID=4085 RepID=A0A1S4DIK1_TOBAC|nr:PREDICTED: GRF1-interacting factor 1-like [Nicotiana sylvestris]XP_016513226.1 PREDICTED: GRF1-interacting factor 1-like [Nicotiana tabacum]